MTDKEPIIIDGVDVSECILRRRKEPKCTICNGYSSKVFEFDCSDFKNCYFKQYARKTQECEELKEKLKFKDNENSNLNKKYRQEQEERRNYRKALEEIEDIVGECPWFDYNAKKIHNIISKAKGGKS